MEMERINENTIRVVLGNDDLTERGITVLDLLGNHKQIESFFYSILEEVDEDHQFQSNDAVTFQVLPSKNGLELYICKGNKGDDDAIELGDDDVDFYNDDSISDFVKGRMMNVNDDDLVDANDELDEDEIDNDNDNIVDEPKTRTERRQMNLNEFVSAGKEPALQQVVVELKDFEDLVQLAEVFQLEGALSDLYLYKGLYYLNLIFVLSEVTPGEVKDQIAIAFEYGNKTKITPAILAEYGKKIMDKSALELTRYYFK